MNENNKINYLELPAKNLIDTKTFYSRVFKWTFTDYGPEYAAFDGAGIDGGFYQSDKTATVEQGSVLIVFYTNDIHAVQQSVEEAGGKITKPIFTFPGGRRFHFSDSNGNELAVWTDPE